jgi:hypothetical protein
VETVLNFPPKPRKPEHGLTDHTELRGDDSQFREEIEHVREIGRRPTQPRNKDVNENWRGLEELQDAGQIEMAGCELENGQGISLVASGLEKRGDNRQQ